MMRKFLRRASSNKGSDPSKDTPEGRATQAVKAFCDSGAPNNPNGGGDEVIHLPVLVETAESSPAAASAAAYNIRKLIKDNYSKPYVQYNGIMLIRILTDNPGPPFTRYIDAKFVDNMKTCLQSSQDPSVQQILRETLYYLSASKTQDKNLQPLLNMWQQEQSKYPRIPGPRPQQQQRVHRPHRPAGLPPPDELAQRIAESKTSAQILIQLSQSTPPQEVEGNDLMKEFSERVLSANRNLHGYMNSTNPAPDPQTFQTLIETCEQLSVASSKHQRAVLAARQAMGGSPDQGAGLGAQTVQQGQDQQPPMPQQQPQQPWQHPAHLSPQQGISPASGSTYGGLTQTNPPPPQASTNPFSDANRITGQPQPQSQSNGITPIRISNTTPPRANTFELPGTYDEPFAAPSGPPPSQLAELPHGREPQAQPQAQSYSHGNAEDDDYDLYATGNTPAVERSEAPMKDWQTPQDSWSSIAASARQDQAVSAGVMSGASGPVAGEAEGQARYYNGVNGGAAGQRVRDV